MTEIELVESLKVLSVEPGDVIVVKAPMRISLENKEAMISVLRESLAEIGFEQVKVLILDSGMDIGVLRSGGV